MSLTWILLIIVIFVVLGGGGYHAYGPYYGGGIGLGGVLAVILTLYLLGVFH